MGGVFSRAEVFTRLSQLRSPVAFHAISTGLGMFCLGKAGVRQQAA